MKPVFCGEIQKHILYSNVFFLTGINFYAKPDISALDVYKRQIFTSGTQSAMLAIGIEDMTLAVGSTLNTEGAIPKLHCKIAPPSTPVSYTHLHLPTPAQIFQSV